MLPTPQLSSSGCRHAGYRHSPGASLPTPAIPPAHLQLQAGRVQLRLGLCCRLTKGICRVAQPPVRRLELQNAGGPRCKRRLWVGRQARVAACLQQGAQVRGQGRSRLDAHVLHGCGSADAAGCWAAAVGGCRERAGMSGKGRRQAGEVLGLQGGHRWRRRGRRSLLTRLCCFSGCRRSAEAWSAGAGAQGCFAAVLRR